MRLLAPIFAVLASPALAAPNVLTDIAPIHGLVSEVMGDLGAPTLLLPPNSDGHHYTMRPSDAQAISDAEVIIRVGDALTPWLSEPLATLAADATVLSLLETSGWTPREIEDDGHGHDHDHGEIDPHAWLDPQIAAIWLGAIADQLAVADPANAEVYQTNAKAAAAEMVALTEQISRDLASATAVPLIWPHDAYGYFAERFGLTSVGAIAESDASDPGPAHIAELRELATQGAAGCVMIDAEINESWAQILTEGTDIQTAAIDPIGAGIPLGSGFYQSLLLQMSAAIASCTAQ